MNIEIANRLVHLRKSHHLSQEALAEKLGISRQAVSKWERAEASPDTDNLIQLAKLYHVSLDKLLEIQEEVLEDEGIGAKHIADEDGGRKRILPGSIDEKVLSVNGIGEESLSMENSGEEILSENKTDQDILTAEEDEKEIFVNKDTDTRNRKESSNGERKESEEQKKKEEYVDIGLGGIHVKDRDGSEVHIGWNGIHVDDKQKGDNVHIDGKGVYVNGEKYDGRKIFIRNFPFTTIVCLLYFAIGILFDAWHPGWLLFLLIPLWYSFAGAVRKKNASIFAYPVLVTLLFLCAGFFWGIWHPGWVLFLTIPLYYFLAPYLNGEED